MRFPSWWSGELNTNLPSQKQVAYDVHSYIKYASDVTQTRDGYLSYTCGLDFASQNSNDSPLYVGEWSLSPRKFVCSYLYCEMIAEEALHSKVNDNQNSEFTTDASDAVSWYTKFFKAQAYAYEKTDGWIFWTWTTQLNDYRSAIFPHWRVESRLTSTQIQMGIQGCRSCWSHPIRYLHSGLHRYLQLIFSPAESAPIRCLV